MLVPDLNFTGDLVVIIPIFVNSSIMQEQEVKRLLERFKAGQCTEEELILVNYWLHKFNEDGASGLSKPDLDNAHQDIWKAIKTETMPSNTYRSLLRFVIPATFLIVMAAAATLFLKSGNSVLPTTYANDIEPGSNKATLTFSTGQVINLSNAKSGITINANGVAYSDGTVLNTKLDQKGSTTLQTPNGGQYYIKLPDGSKVWLNAASTLKFPTTFFTTANRKVDLSGEAYFEVAKDPKHPFIVTTNNQEVEVLGTHFNISGYKGEPIKTTLLEGSVRINGKTTLVPGDQSTNVDNDIKVKQVDTDESIAWKNGEFMFRNEPLENIMQKVARWYDLEVSYENTKVGKQVFGGTISKFGKVSEVLMMLELTGDVHFEVSGRKIKVKQTH